MAFIDEKFKERKPEETVALIQQILKQNGIEVTELWHDSGLAHCYSMSLTAHGGIPISNGKGITKALAQASAYGEFIERLQGGLFLSKFQSIDRDPVMNIHTFAPDVKYMTVQELIAEGDWMDAIIKEYKDPAITRQSIGRLCKLFDPTPGDKVLTLPFYSLFEKKYVYFPMAFYTQIYGTNGCCAGNTRDEAWVHALSEMMERHASIKMLLSGEGAPSFPDEVLRKYDTVAAILDAVRENGDFDVDILDYSEDNGYPVVATRIINKKNHSYRVNVAADPVFEIAIQRTLTELFQGMSVHNFYACHNGRICNKKAEQMTSKNIVNQLENGSGTFTADYFANDLTCTRQAATFEDHSSKTNAQLLDYALGLYRKLDRPVYVRNFSYLGFPSYRFIVPGFSEALALNLTQPVSNYTLADMAAKLMKDPAKAMDYELTMFLAYNNKQLAGVFSRYYNYGKVSGVPLMGMSNDILACVTRAYAAYRLKLYNDAILYSAPLCQMDDEDMEQYFSLVNKYLELKQDGVSEEKNRCILRKFYLAEYCDRLFEALDAGKTPYDAYLLKCDLEHCEDCRYREHCAYQANRNMHLRIGEVYKTFTDGQNEAHFAI